MNKLDKLITELHQNELDDPDRQFNVAIALGQNHDLVVRPRIVAELIKALTPGHQALSRAHASEALGEIRDATAIPALIDALQDPYRLVRSYAARALGKMDCVESSAAIDPLITVLKKDEFFGARAEAAEALGKVFKCCKQANLADSELLKRAETAVRQHEQEELKQFDKRLQRVINETRKAINEIGNAAVGLSDEDKAKILADLSALAEQFKALQKEAAIRLA
jgi:HEAT repeat protein